MPSSRKRKSSAVASFAAKSDTVGRRDGQEASKRSRKVDADAEAPQHGGSAVSLRDTICDCNTLAAAATTHNLRLHRNFRAACQLYLFPGSHQVGSYGPSGAGIVRTYSNATPGKDIVLNGGRHVLYRLKDDIKLRAQFEVNRRRKRPVRVFRKVEAGVLELGEFLVEGFVPAGPDDAVRQFGPTFVKFARVEALASSHLRVEKSEP